jgi:hypothetical protein
VKRCSARTQRFEEAAAIARAFDIGADDARFRIAGEVQQQVGFGEVERVAVADDLAEAKAARRPVQHQLDAVVAALADEGDVALRAGQIRPERKPGPRVEDPHAVGPEDADAGVSRGRQHALFERRCLRVAGLAEAASEEVERSDALRARMVNQVEHPISGDARDDEVDRPGHIGERGVGGEPGDLSRARVDRVDGSLEPRIDNGADVVVAGAIDIARSAGDRDGAGREEGSGHGRRGRHRRRVA